MEGKRYVSRTNLIVREMWLLSSHTTDSYNGLQTRTGRLP